MSGRIGTRISAPGDSTDISMSGRYAKSIVDESPMDFRLRDVLNCRLGVSCTDLGAPVSVFFPELQAEHSIIGIRAAYLFGFLA
jgi:hypothetical protein